MKNIKADYSEISRKEIFQKIYENGEWGGDGHFYSGGMSHSKRIGGAYVRMIKKLIEQYNVHTVCDLGCGDFYVASKYVKYLDKYIGVDVAENVIRENQKLYGNEKISFVCADIVEEELPDADMCILRQVLQHMTTEDVQVMFEKTKKYKYVVITERITSKEFRKSVNADKPTGAGNRTDFGSGLYFDEAPFNVKNIKVINRIQFDVETEIVSSIIVNE